MSAATLTLYHLAEAWRQKAAHIRVKYAAHPLACEPAASALETCAEELEEQLGPIDRPITQTNQQTPKP